MSCRPPGTADILNNKGGGDDRDEMTFSSRAAILSFRCSCSLSLDSDSSLSTVSERRLLCSSFMRSRCLACGEEMTPYKPPQHKDSDLNVSVAAQNELHHHRPHPLRSVSLTNSCSSLQGVAIKGLDLCPPLVLLSFIEFLWSLQQVTLMAGSSEPDSPAAAPGSSPPTVPPSVAVAPQSYRDAPRPE